ncbi:MULTISPECIES: site-2 protease family protein [Dictyoglomus]|jgi:Zn-dependent protease|uniref:Peptidase M50 n=1 Tax=Dictyoglomus turgidum (strain DSM 6724 / Z-1310) TaxID=515635 RepID=B8E107_DICTD|nr:MULTISPECIES: site-2 protease family protein [Dictyoglomus]ACK42744.1 peptidase M50 [Dictyoglomus turgidum DSM 6724]HBU30803.1 site-2 protease family protein [Dictyoglomus sp.]
MEFSNLVTYLWRIIAILIAITVHEFAHGKMAEIEGDITPRLSGRLTLNPLAHIDPIGFLMLLLFRFGWAKPVPVNFDNLRRGDKSVILVSLAGPLANFSLAFLVSIFWRFDLPVPIGFVSFCIELAILNVFLGIFNLIPIPPLDGSHILEALLPYKYKRYYQSIGIYGVLILMILILTNGLYIIISPLLNLFLYLLGLRF